MCKGKTSNKQMIIKVIIFVIALMVAFVCYSLDPNKRINTDATCLYPNREYSFSLNKAQIRPNGVYAPTGDDPYLSFSFAKPILIQSISIELAAPINNDINIDVYYAREGKTFSEEEVKCFTLQASSQELTTDLPLGECTALRIDINDRVRLRTIKVSEKTLKPMYPWVAFARQVVVFILVFLFSSIIAQLIRSCSVYNKQTDGSLLTSRALTVGGLLFLGISLRFVLMSFGYNFDFESYCIVGEIAGNFRNVYAETYRYNYGPVFFFLQGLLYRLSLIAGGNWKNLYRVLIVIMLTFTDLSITVFIANRYSLKTALIFFLNPVSIYISGYHNQFDNIAILFALLAIPYYNESPSINWKDLGFVLFITLSLITKHILFLIPVFFLLSTRLSLPKKVLYAFLPPSLFIMSFVPFVIGNNAAFQGVLHNVFFYRSYNNAPLFQLIYKLIGFGTGYEFYIYIICMIIFAFTVKNLSFDFALLIYFIAMVSFSSAIADQYIAIPMVAICILNTGIWRKLYMGFAGLYFFMMLAGAYLKEMMKLHPVGLIPYAEAIVARGYTILALLLLIMLIRLIILNNKKAQLLNCSI